MRAKWRINKRRRLDLTRLDSTRLDLIPRDLEYPRLCRHRWSTRTWTSAVAGDKAPLLKYRLFNPAEPFRLSRGFLPFTSLEMPPGCVGKLSIFAPTRTLFHSTSPLFFLVGQFHLTGY